MIIIFSLKCLVSEVNLVTNNFRGLKNIVFTFLQCFIVKGVVYN